VYEVGSAIAELTGLPILSSCLRKTKETRELKDVYDLSKRTEMLMGAFAVDGSKTTGKRLLLFDDLYRSGATATEITRALKEEGKAAAVYLLTLTRTRRNV
jgi:predicted amidophosphoribosyltransferase